MPLIYLTTGYRGSNLLGMSFVIIFLVVICKNPLCYVESRIYRMGMLLYACGVSIIE